MRLVVLAMALVGVVACNRVDPPPATADAGATPAAEEKPNALVELTAEQVSATPVLSAACNLEAIGGNVVQDMNPIVISGRTFEVSGWIVDDEAKQPPGRFELRAYSTSGDGRIWQTTVSPSIGRPDVQAARGGASSLLNSGFSARVDAAGLPVGRYNLRLAFRAGNKETVCDNGRAVVLE